MKHLLTTTALVLALAAPAAFAQNQQGSSSGSQQQQHQQPPSASGQQRSQAQAPQRITLVSASNLIDRTVQDSQGTEAGKIHYVLVDSQTGEVTMAVLGSGGQLDLGNQFVAVPWSAISANLQGNQGNQGHQGLRLTTLTVDQLRQAPRINAEALADLTQPAVITQVTDFFAPAGRSGQGAGQRPGAQQGQAAQQGSAQGQGAQMPGAQQQAGAQPARPQILVGREVITTLAPPLMVSPREIRGTEVRSGTSVLGRISQIMIDPDRGQVAYVLVSPNGSAGQSASGSGGQQPSGASGQQQPIPIPFAALQWAAGGTAYQLAGNAKLHIVQGLPTGKGPTQVSGDQLKQLYTDFNVQPYWQQGLAGRRVALSDGQHGQAGTHLPVRAVTMRL